MSNKHVIFVFRELDENEKLAVIKSCEENNTEVFATSDNAAQIKEIAIVAELDPQEKSSINYQIMKQLLAFGDKLIDGQSVSDRLSIHQKASIWYYHKFRLYFLMLSKHYETALIKKLTGIEGDYNNVIIYTKHRLDNYLAGKFSIRLPATKSNASLLSFSKFLCVAIARFIINLFAAPNPTQKNVILDRGNLQPMLLPDGSTQTGNQYLEYLLRQAGTDYVIFNDLEIPKFFDSKPYKLSGAMLRKRKRSTGTFFSETVVLKGLFKKGVWQFAKSVNKNLRDVYTKISENAENSLEKDLIFELSLLHKTSLFYAFIFESYHRFFGRNKIKSIVAIDENSPVVKAILDAAKSWKISTVGIQHGNIHDLHPAYLFTEIDRDKRVVPDKTLVWGDFWRKFLIETGNYPHGSIGITGQIRTDIITSLKKRKPALFDSGKKNIVYASQPQQDINLRYRAAADVFEAMKLLGDDYQLHIKLHPRERLDIPYYKNIAAQTGCTNYAFITGTDLYLIIASCDVLITCFSTVGTETVYFKKPLIILDHLKQDIQNFHKEGVAVQAVNAEQLAEFVGGFCSGRKVIDAAKYDHFITKYAHRIDGKTCERIFLAIADVAGVK